MNALDVTFHITIKFENHSPTEKKGKKRRKKSVAFLGAVSHCLSSSMNDRLVDRTQNRLLVLFASTMKFN